MKYLIILASELSNASYFILHLEVIVEIVCRIDFLKIALVLVRKIVLVNEGVMLLLDSGLIVSSRGEKFR